MNLRVALFNTFSKGGGAAIACQRLRKALRSSISFSMSSINREGFLPKYLWLLKLAVEKWKLKRHLKASSLQFHFDTNDYGISHASTEAVKAADLLHLHWVNQGFMSLDELEKLFQSGKPVVWTLHDMWAFTGGCHYSGACTRYENGCGSCPMLKNPFAQDLSAQVLARKKKLFDTYRPEIVTCSNWLADCARKSLALERCKVIVIPNPIDTEVFKPADKPTLRTILNLPADKQLLLFSSARLDDPRKGIHHLLEALSVLDLQHPELRSSLELVFMGAVKEALPTLPYKMHTTGFVSGDENLAEYYAASDVFVLPSTEDNLPNTVMEAVACGTPAVAFHIGGLSDLIGHMQDGYLAKAFDVEDLAKGIVQVLRHQGEYSVRCREKALNRFSEKVAGKQYYDLYQSALSTKSRN